MQTSTELRALLERLLAGVELELSPAVELRHRLHARPELAHREEQTAATLAAELPVPSTRVATTGLIARVGAGQSAIAVRAELDGLPLQERTGSPFTAHDGVMHACGHDVHMAALIALTRAAHSLASELPAPLLAVFQPSEEAYPSGAQQLADGELAAIAPAAVVAAHVDPELAWGSVALDVGTVNASCDAIEIRWTGSPRTAPIRIRAAIRSSPSRRSSWPSTPGRSPNRASRARRASRSAVLEGGSAENVIPAQARARGALRAHRAEDRLALRQMVEEVVSGVAAAHGCRGRVELVPGEPALENDPEIVAHARELLTQAGLAPAQPWRSCGSDDFAFFGALAPVAMGFVGLHGAEGFLARPLHHPELLPPDSAVGALARTLAVLYVAAAATASLAPAPRRLPRATRAAA